MAQRHTTFSSSIGWVKKVSSQVPKSQMKSKIKNPIFSNYSLYAEITRRVCPNCLMWWLNDTISLAKQAMHAQLVKQQLHDIPCLQRGV